MKIKELFGNSRTNEYFSGPRTVGEPGYGKAHPLHPDNVKPLADRFKEKFKSLFNKKKEEPKREWTAFEMACMEGGHPLPEDTVNEKCWDGYKQVGMKNKGGRQVPNCVPEDAAGVGIITKQNTTADVKPGDEYKNVKKLHLEFKQFIAEAQQYKGAIFLNDRTAIVGQAHKQTPELSPETLKRVQDIATKYGAYSEGNGADEPYTKAIGITNYKGSWDDLFAGSISGYPWQFIYSIMANVNDNRTWDQIGEDPNKTVFNQILASQQNHNFFPGKRYDGQTLLKFLEAISEGNNNFVEMAKLPATKKNVYEFLKKGESLMFPSNWQSYPYKAGRVAKAANDARDKFLAKRTQGAYFVGDGHLLNIQTLANKKIEENFQLKEATVQDVIRGYLNSEIGKKYARYDCKTVTRAFLKWAKEKNIPTQVLFLAPPSAETIKQNPQFKGKSGTGDAHIMPVVSGQAIDFTVRQFLGKQGTPYEKPLITPVGQVKQVYNKLGGYYTDAPAWMNNKSDYLGSTVPPSIAKMDFGDELLENFADGKVKGKSRPGRVKRAGASCKGSVTSLRSKAKRYGGERGKMYHWCANMKSGRSKK